MRRSGDRRPVTGDSLCVPPRLLQWKLFLCVPLCPLWCALVLLFALPALAQQPDQLPQLSNASAVRPPSPEHQFPNGLTLVYQAEWRLWTAGTARFTLEDAGSNM